MKGGRVSHGHDVPTSELPFSTSHESKTLRDKASHIGSAIKNLVKESPDTLEQPWCRENDKNDAMGCRTHL